MSIKNGGYKLELNILEQNGMRVLPTAQLAKAYGTTSDKISYNFKYNEKRYQSGKHFILLTGSELKEFKEANREFQGTLNKLYLWTEKGAWLHAKSLNTDQAWDAYERLVDTYYEIQKSIDPSSLSPELQMFKKIFDTVVAQELKQKQLAEQVEQTRSEVKGIREIVALNTRDWRKDVNKILNDIARKHGGYDEYRKIRNESYQVLEQRANANLSIRVTNKQKKMALEGVSKSKVDKVSKLDVIDEDKRLLEIYLTVIKEMAIKYQVEVRVS